MSKIKKKTGPENNEEMTSIVYTIASFFFVLVILGIPIWWYTTRVYRATLPLSDMYRDIKVRNVSTQFGVPLSLEYDILITLVNPDPTNLEVNFKGGDMETYLQPFLDTISPIADFSVKSQWLFLVELGAIPRKMEDHYAIFENQLPHIITPLERRLWSHLTSRPCLNFILYFPHCQSPLYIYDNQNKKSKTNAFLSPRWGGLYIMNADETSCSNKNFTPNMQSIISTITAQLQNLLNLDGTSEKEINYLMQRKAEDMIDSTRRTLRSLAQLLSEINSIVISDDVADKINDAVAHADVAEEELNKGNIKSALKSAKIAYKNSEAAFSDPSLLALLYFPDDQKYAVYIPLFLPVMIPVVMSLTTLRKWYVNRSN